MCKQSGIIVETTKSAKIVRTLFGSIALKVHADEPVNDDDNKGDDNKPTPTINYEDLIVKARKEEKEKQYKTIEKLRGQIDTLTKQHNDDLLKIAGFEKDLEEANTKLSSTNKGDNEAITTLKNEIATLTKDKGELESKIADLSNNIVDRAVVEEEVRKQLEAEYEVKSYKVEKMAELKDDILVPELVMGNTKEEIDASIKSALDRSKQIRESLGVNNIVNQDKRTPKTPNNPSISGIQDSNYSLEYLASLNPASPEYAEVRKKLGLC